MKELNTHKEFILCHGRDVIIHYKGKLIEGKLSVNRKDNVYFCFYDSKYKVNRSECEELFGCNRPLMISHYSSSSRYEQKYVSKINAVYLREQEIVHKKNTQDRIDKLELELKQLKEDTALEHQMYLQKLVNDTNNISNALYVEASTKLKLRYKGTTVIQVNREGLITYRKNEDAVKAFKEWLNDGKTIAASNAYWNGYYYFLGSSRKEETILYSKDAYADTSIAEGVLNISEGIGLITTDENIMKMEHNNRAVVHY